MSRNTEQTTTAMQLPKPPSPAETARNPEQTFAWIKSRIAEIYATGRYGQQQQLQEKSLLLDQPAYVQFYTTVHAYCRPHRGEQREPGLYRTIQEAIRTHCREASAYIAGKAPGEMDSDGADTILSTYLKQWKEFLEISVRVRNLFSPLEKTWVWRAIDAEPPLEGVYLFPELHRRYWREEVLGVNETAKGSSKVLEAVKWRRQNEGQNQTLVDEVIATFDDSKVALVDGLLVAVDQ